MLRQVVRELREVFSDADGGRSVCSARDPVRREAIEVDVWTVIHAAEGRGPSAPASTPAPAGRTLGRPGRSRPRFRAWTIAKRHTLSDRLLRALERAMTERARIPRQCRVAQAILNLDPTHEHACRRLMRARVSLGDTALRCAPTKRCGTCSMKTTKWSPRRRPSNSSPKRRWGHSSPISRARGEPLCCHQAAAFGYLGCRDCRNARGSPGAIAPARWSTGQVDPDKTHLVLGFRQLLIASLVVSRVAGCRCPVLATGRLATADGRGL